MADDPTLDPRFDPAFQRGFEGTVGVTRRRPPAGVPSVVPAQELAGRSAVAPAERTSLEHPPPELAPGGLPLSGLSPAERPRVGSSRPHPDSASEQAPESDSDATPRRVNPFLIALLGIAIVLIAAGIAGAQFANAAFQTNLTTSVSYVTVLLVIASSAVSVGLGVATLIGIVFLYAARSLRH